MDNNAAYCVMIFSPFLFFNSKLSIHYTIVYSKLRKNHSKTYIKKTSGNFWERFFLSRFKAEIDMISYYTNMLLGVLVIVGTIIALIYFLLWVVGYKLQYMFIPYITIYIDVGLSIMRILRLAYERIFLK